MGPSIEKTSWLTQGASPTMLKSAGKRPPIGNVWCAQKLHELVDYVDNQWINTNTFPPSSWSFYGQPVRTNNDIEGWHTSLNRRAGGRVHLPFYLLIQLHHRESSVCNVQVRLVNARKLQRIQRKKYGGLFQHSNCSDADLLSKQNTSTYKNNSKNHTVTDITSFFEFRVLF